METTVWQTITRRTDYPKLGYLIRRFEEAGLTCRFATANGVHLRTAHADKILEVHEADAPRAWAILGERWSRVWGAPRRQGATTLDDMPDDHPAFRDYHAVEPATNNSLEGS